MKSYDRLIRDLARETRAPEQAVSELEARLEAGELAAHAPLPELDGIGGASPDRVDALRRRVASSQPRRRSWRLPVFAAVGAAALLLIWLRPAPTPAPPSPVAGAPVDVEIAPEPPPVVPPMDRALAGPQQLALSHGVQLSGDGAGHLTHVDADTDLVWTAGRVTFDVPPGQGLSVAVRTPDARVEVVGTVFSVERGPDGTRASVERGKVRVTCVGQEPALVTAGQDLTCERRRASALLAMARRMEAAGDPSEAVLVTLDTALLDDSAPAPIRQELLYQSAVWLERKGDRAAAIDRLEACLAQGEGLRTIDARERLERLRP